MEDFNNEDFISEDPPDQEPRVQDSFKENLTDTKSERYTKFTEPMEKKRRWNEYMRNYRARMKKQTFEAITNPKCIPLEYNNRTILCNCDVLREVFMRYTHLLINLYNLNIDSFDDATTEALDAHSGELMTFSKILVGAFEELIRSSPLTATSLF